MIPEHTKFALMEWVHYGNTHDHGSFLMALVNNQLIEAFEAADDINQMYMLDIVKWIYSNIPMCCLRQGAKEYTGMCDDMYERWARGK